MSRKNITIQEGGVAKQLSVDKLKTNKVGGGTLLWVPEDEVSLGTKSVTANGTYKASDDGKYGFSQVTVNVSGSYGSANPDGTPSVGGGPTSDGGGGSTPDGGGVPAGGPGSCVVGTDPITGNEQAVGVDSNGNLVTTPIPSSIEIVESPNTTSYSDGSPIDLTGATVIAKNADGSTWTSDDYPDGIIPISDLILATPTADASQASGPTAGGFQIIDITNRSIDEVFEEATADRMGGAGQGVFHGIQITISSNGGVNAFNPENGRSIGKTFNFNYTDGVESAFFAIDNSGGYVLAIVSKGHNQAFYSAIGSLSYLLGDVDVVDAGMQPISIKWPRPADQKDLETSFNITLNGGGYSDDSGGSESGGGTNIPGGGSSSDSGGSNSGGGGNF